MAERAQLAGPERLRFAQVVVFVPLDRRLAKTEEDAGISTLVDFSPASQTFTYGIPTGQRGQHYPGQVVWVPFGRTRRQGVILKLTETAPEGVEVRAIGEPITVGPALTLEQIDLALWLSEHYLAPLSECVKLILPPGFGGGSEVVLEAVSGAPEHYDDLSPGQQALLLRLRRESMLLSDLRKQDRRLVKDDVLGELMRHGLVRMRDQMKGGRPKPKRIRHVALAIPADGIDAALMQLGRSSKQADALIWLAEHADSVPTLDAVATAIDSTPGPIKSLAKKGLVTITPDGRVQLDIPPEEIPATVIAMRGSERYRPVLESLAKYEQPIPVSQLYEDAESDAATVKRLADAEIVVLTEVEVWRDPLEGRVFEPDQLPTLTGDQAKAWAKITAGLDIWLDQPPADESPPVYLLHGVTGSGKTELYLRALRRAVDAGRQGIVLVPEISLTPQTLRRFAARFPGRVAVVHSKLTDGERYDTWRRAREGEFDVVVGSRSALFTPFPNIGVVVVDEEHDTAYKQARTPRYHARDAAIELARLSGAITLLGSATPSLESSFQARRGMFTLLELPRRVMGHRLDVGEERESAGDNAGIAAGRDH